MDRSSNLAQQEQRTLTPILSCQLKSIQTCRGCNSDLKHSVSPICGIFSVIRDPQAEGDVNSDRMATPDSQLMKGLFKALKSNRASLPPPRYQRIQ